MQFLEDLVVSGSINEQALTHISLNTGRFRVIQLLKIIARSDCNVLLICLRTYVPYTADCKSLATSKLNSGKPQLSYHI